MADSLQFESSSKILSNLSSSSVPPGSPIRYIKSGRTVRIPVQRIRCGRFDFRAEEKWLEYEPSSTALKIIYRDRQHFEHQECVAFNVRDISAADLRVSARFGCLDAMNGALTLECNSRIETTSCDSTRENTCTTFVVELTFHVNYTGQMRDILRALRQAKLAEVSTSKKDNTVELNEKHKATLREGLPDWVQYLPRTLYTPYLRHAIETLLVFYTVFSIMWALWQLYRHVDFIRAYVRPLIETLINHIHTLDKLIQVANAFFEEYTRQWMAYLKPVCLILYSTATPLIHVGKQVWASVTSLSLVTLRPLIYCLQPVLDILNFIFIKTPATLLKPVYQLLVTMWSLFYDTIGQRIYLPHVGQFFQNLLYVMKDILERSVRLDPLKAQLILMRSNVLNSGKSLGMGMVYMYKYIEKKVWLIFRSETDEDKED